MGSVLDPAAIGDIPLLDATSDSGAAFVLDEKAPQNAIAGAGEGWVVEVREGSIVVVARGAGARTPSEAHSFGAAVAQRGLDLLSMRGAGDLLIRRADDENLTWWKADDARRIVRATSVAPLRLTVGTPGIRITDASGADKTPPPPPPAPWHPSFRYFRLAQVSEEVFDAYRNLYLALESVLSSATPPKPGEREFDWFARALTDLANAGINVAGYAPAGATDPVAAIRGDLYSAVRTATFHAKAAAPTLLPLDPIDRDKVVARLSRLAGLYLAIAEHTLGARRPSGAVMKGGFDMFIGGVIPDLEVNVTDDEIRVDETATTVNPGGGHVQKIATRPCPELDKPFVRTIVGQAPVAELAALTRVTRIVSVHKDGDPVTAGQLEAPLALGGFDDFEAVMALRGLNVKLPRTFYSA